MKRKLNEADVPVEVSDDGDTHSAKFEDLNLDSRLLQAIAKSNYSVPTPVQLRTIPLALSGKDLIVRSQTGSGKTAAYAFPIIQSILQRKSSIAAKATSALILVPTRELAQQISKAVTSFCAFCLKDVRTVNITQKTSEEVQRTLLADLPDIVVATPASAAQNLTSSALSLESLTNLVIDEADLVMSYGYEDDLQIISAAVPKGVRTSLISATLTADVTTLKGLFCHDPVVIDVQEVADGKDNILQYVVKCAEEEKFLLSYVMFKLKLVKGKCIIFVGDIDRCYRLKLFLEQFGIRSCVLNSELPVNSRIHVVEEFNKGVYDIIIASDESEVLGENEIPKDSEETENAHQSGASKPSESHEKDANKAKTAAEDEKHKRPAKKARKSKKHPEYGISRGIDFQNVNCVLNFDFPTTSTSYTHRIGRTARAGKNGMALSLVVPRELYRKHPPTSFPTAEHDEKVLAQVEQDQCKQRRHSNSNGISGKNGYQPSEADNQDKQKEAPPVLQPYHFDKTQIEPFRYRMTSALRAVTRLAIREARTRELRSQLIASEKLAHYFEEHPDELKHLRYDSELRAAQIQPHLRHVPDYLMPRKGGQDVIGADNNAGKSGIDVGSVGLRKRRVENGRKDGRKGRGRWEKRGKAGTGKKTNPLKSFRA